MGLFLVPRLIQSCINPLLIFVKMLLRAYPLLGTTSQRAMRRTVWRYGRSYQYIPRANLLIRIGKTLGISQNAAYKLLMTEREYLIKNGK